MALNFLIEISGDEESAITFLQKHKVLRADAPNCATCGRLMTLEKSGTGEELAYRCPDHKTVKASLKASSYFENSILSFSELVRLIFLWAYRTPPLTTVALLGLPEWTIAEWFQSLRDICSNFLRNNSYQIGGPGLTVEIETYSVPKLTVAHSSEDASSDRLVFGGVCKETGQGLLILISNKETDTLLALIQDKISPGSIIHTSGQNLYKGIKNIQVEPAYQHIAGSKKGARTDRIETIWLSAKRRYKTYNGALGDNSELESHLDEYNWRELHGKVHEKALDNILLHLSQWYPT